MNALPQILANCLITASLYALIALGFSMVYRTVKFFDFAYGSVLVLSGYFMYLCTRVLPLPISLSVIISILLSGIFGLLCYRLIYVPLMQKKASRLIFVLASLGIYTVIQAIIGICFSSQFHTVVSDQKVFYLGTIVIAQVQVITFAVAIILALALSFFLKRSRIGKAIRAVSDDREVASIIGINVRQVTGLVFAIGSILGGIAGILSAYDYGLEPSIGFPMLLKGVIASIVGGMRTIWGVMSGALLLAVVENVGVWQLSAEWKDVIAFSILIIFLLFSTKKTNIA